ncbi:6738_t:CDS:1, partial [Gigaspora rosea]
TIRTSSLLISIIAICKMLRIKRNQYGMDWDIILLWVKEFNDSRLVWVIFTPHTS